MSDLSQIQSAVTPLARKAMLVKLTTRRPSTSHKFDATEQAAARALVGDRGAELKGNLFIDPRSPVRLVYAHQAAIYRFHKENTLPYEDRGPRLLPVSRYEFYRDEGRRLVGELDAEIKALLPEYDNHVQADIRLRAAEAALNGKTSAASVADYPTKEQFEASLGCEFKFSPLPDQSHWLFDIDPADAATLQGQLDSIEQQARADLYERVKTPLVKLLEKLRIPAGQPGAIFRDTAVSNITEATTIARALCMDDPAILQLCDTVDAAVKPVAANPDILRESPVVREAAAAKLAQVQGAMAAFFGA